MQKHARSSKTRSTPQRGSKSKPAARLLAEAPPGQKINWPPFNPRLPVVALQLEAPSPDLGEKVLVIRHFFPKVLCRNYVSFLQGLPLTTTPGRPKRGEAVRVNDRYQIDDVLFSQRMWLESGLKNVLSDEPFKHLWGGEVVGLNPNIRVYRYSKGQFFDAHYDDTNVVMLPASDSATGSISAKTTWTLLLYLTSAAEGCIGGETVFYPRSKAEEEGIAIPLETGMLLLHRHGDECLLSPCTPVAMPIIGTG
ncbi:hypothetical protein BX600DRAFT_305534 [Xylariales sp. PMI_506]|nr:hypothetical protein BX600DRAFT_305534 [Xylariales sp. PMI_506]